MLFHCLVLPRSRCVRNLARMLRGCHEDVLVNSEDWPSADCTNRSENWKGHVDYRHSFQEESDWKFLFLLESTFSKRTIVREYLNVTTTKLSNVHEWYRSLLGLCQATDRLMFSRRCHFPIYIYIYESV